MNPSSLRVLTFTTLFPNAEQPLHGVFVRARIRELAKLCQVKVVAPIRWFPGSRWLHRRYAAYARVTSYEKQDELDVYHPRAFTIPRLGKALDGLLLFCATVWSVWRIRRRFPFDLIDAHWAFPDGFAAILLGMVWRVPVTITVRGDDLSVLSSHLVRRRLVAWVLRRATRVIAVCDALKQKAHALGAQADNVLVIANGVDARAFFPTKADAMRRQLDLPIDRRLILSVGHICERKGFHLIVDALRQLRACGIDDVDLVIVGGPGEEDEFLATLQATIDRQGLKADVHLAGPRPNEELLAWYNACDVFCLASAREGWPNVVLEALACGRPVVATNVWGTPEIITSSEYGLLVEREPVALARGLEQALSQSWDRARLASYAHSHTWSKVAQKVYAEFGRVCSVKSTEEQNPAPAAGGPAVDV